MEVAILRIAGRSQWGWLALAVASCCRIASTFAARFRTPYVDAPARDDVCRGFQRYILDGAARHQSGWDALMAGGGGAEAGSLLFEQPAQIGRDRARQRFLHPGIRCLQLLERCGSGGVLLLDQRELVLQQQHLLVLEGAQAVLLGGVSDPPLVCADQFIDSPVLVGDLVVLALDVHQTDDVGPDPRQGEYTHHTEDLRSIGREQTK